MNSSTVRLLFLVLQLMSAQAFASQQEDALHSLTQYVRMGQANEEVLKAKQFDALRLSLPYPRIHDEMTANTASISVADKGILRFPAGACCAIPEDIDYDPGNEAVLCLQCREQRYLCS